MSQAAFVLTASDYVASRLGKDLATLKLLPSTKRRFVGHQVPG